MEGGVVLKKEKNRKKNQRGKKAGKDGCYRLLKWGRGDIWKGRRRASEHLPNAHERHQKGAQGGR